LEQKAATWKQEIEIKKTEIKKLKDALASEKVLLTKVINTNLWYNIGTTNLAFSNFNMLLFS
jgi:hypothetical protein